MCVYVGVCVSVFLVRHGYGRVCEPVGEYVGAHVTSSRSEMTAETLVPMRGPQPSSP